MNITNYDQGVLAGARVRAGRVAAAGLAVLAEGKVSVDVTGRRAIMDK